MNKKGLFCDGTGGYVIPPEPSADQQITLRFRTVKDDVEEIYLIARHERIKMIKEDTQGKFDFYCIDWQLGHDSLAYFFEVRDLHEVCYYNRLGAVDEMNEEFSFVINPGFSTPDWAKGAVMYQIFVDRFYNGDSKNDVVTGEYFYIDGISRKIDNWQEYPISGAAGVRQFYGGDLEGVRQKLDYLQELGVEVIYFNPLFVSPSNHKYDIEDYDYIDPHFGVIINDGGTPLPDDAVNNDAAEIYRCRVTNKENLEASNQFFVQLVEEIHSRNMKVILDGVFNHCGSFNKWMDRERIYEHQEDYAKGAYISKDSPYNGFFKFHDQSEERWPYNDSYDGWWGHNTLPKLNYEGSEKLKEYILAIGKKWVSPPFNADGWRLDVAADLGFSNEYNHEFWKEFRLAVKEANPQALILAEHYGDPKEWLQGDEWDTVMNYDAFMEPVTWFLTGMEKHSDDNRQDLLGNADYFVNTITYHMTRFLTSSLQVAMNELSNHDHSRFLTRTNHMVGRSEGLGAEAAGQYVNYAVMREAVVMQMTWVGAPTIYYGDEAGLCGFTDPDNRRTYPWGAEDSDLIRFHQEMIVIHKEHQTLKTGSLKMLTWEKDILSYTRFDEQEQLIIILNNSTEVKVVEVPVWEAGVPFNGILRRLIYTYNDGYTTEDEKYLVQEGKVVVNMGDRSALVMKAEES